jgi:HD superfamily phosphodiesterase
MTRWHPLAVRLRRERTHVVLLGLALAGLAGAHLAVGVATHGEHVVHVALELAFLLPIVAAAAWFGLLGGVGAAGAAALLLGAHALWSWRGQPMEIANQLGMTVVYLVVGAVTGALVSAENRERERRVEQERRATREKVVEALAALQSALGFRHEVSRGHGKRVAELSVRLGRALQLDAERLDRLRLAALVHDLGKIGLPDDILLKPSELTAEERHHLEQHPLVAANILLHVSGTEAVAEIVLCHHERLDGSGYPRGLTAPSISLESRILAVADVYCALAELRPYRPVLATSTILALIAPLAGKLLDAQACAALRDAVEEEAVR